MRLKTSIRRMLIVSLVITLLVRVVPLASGLVYADSQELEPNDDFNNATYVSVNETIKGFSSDDDDYDRYRFDIIEDGLIWIDFTTNEKPASMQIWVNRSDGVTELFNSYVITIDNNTPRYKSMKVPMPKGTYCLTIHSSSYDSGGNQNPKNKFSYNYKINYTNKGINWEREPNDSFKKSNIINVNKAYYGFIGEPYNENDGDPYNFETDWDYYKFNIQKDGPIELQVDIDEVRADATAIQLYDIKGENLSYRWSVIKTNKNKYVTDPVKLEKGWYYCAIRREGDSIPYSIKINYTFPNVLKDAKPIKLNQKTNAIPNNDYWYKLDIKKAMDYIIAFSGKGLINGAYRHLYIYDSSWSKEYDYSWTGDVNHQTESFYLDSGTYYIKVDYTEPFSLNAPMGARHLREEEYDFVVKEKIGGSISNRIYGNSRYDTATDIANNIKKLRAGKMFPNIIVATGTRYPDALAGSVLAIQKDAPIIITTPSKEGTIIDYINSNLKKGGTVYILGGTGAIPNSFETKLKATGIKYKRLGGSTRYETNLMILNELTKSSSTLIVATGNNFPDALSASAIGYPILIVGDRLTKEQIKYLQKKKFESITIVGGTGAVSNRIKEALSQYGKRVNRVAGGNRYETSQMVANRFFKTTRYVVLSIGRDFPDALTGGPLANELSAPMILTSNNSNEYSYAKEYKTTSGVKKAITLGGPSLISDGVVKEIMK